MTTTDGSQVDQQSESEQAEKNCAGLRESFIAPAMLVALAAGLFRHHLLGSLTFFGNADRLDNHLKVLKHHVDSLAAGHLDAWSDIELLGYDTFSLPYTFPNPLTYLTYWLGPENIYVTAGFVSAALLAIAGVCAYAALRQFVDNKLTSFVGAVLYEFSTITVLKVSQNDMSFAVFILIPLLILTIKRIERHKPEFDYAVLSFLLFVLLQFTFLQKAAYALLLTGSYALYRSWERRDWRPAFVFAAAGLTAVVAAAPRIWALAIAMSQYTRGETERGPLEISPFELLRWFDSTIFGTSFSDPVAIANGVNLTEGFLLYMSGIVPVLIVIGLIRYREWWFRLIFNKDASFFVWFLAFLFAVFAFKPVFYLVYYLFLKVDFIHARILVAGVLPMAILVSMLLSDMAPAPLPKMAKGDTFIVFLCGLGMAVCLVAGIEATARLGHGAWHVPEEKLFLSRVAMIRIALSTIIGIALICILKLRFLSPLKRYALFVTLCLTIVGQTLLAADFLLNGPQTRTGNLPFKKGDFYSADRTDFHIPVRDRVNTLHAALNRDEFRSVMICNPQIAGGFCAAHIGEFWRLRLADGYYGLGVPKRIAALPWKAGLGLRQVLFVSSTNLPWQLLGFLNVKYAVVADDALYRNAPSDNDWPNLARHQPEVLTNPAPVIPRAFFPKVVRPSRSAREAANSIFNGSVVNDVTQTSYVEGLEKERTFATEGKITVEGGGDRLVVHLDRSERPRFLVLNELFYPGWSARIGGREAAIYPTNAVMRGVIVPPGATKVTFHYTPFVKTTAAKVLYSMGLLLAVIGTFAFRRLSPQ